MPSPFECSIQIVYTTPEGPSQSTLWGLNILTISDSWDAALAQYEFIGADGAIIDNLGFNARKISFTTYWYGTKSTFPIEYTSPTYENHFEFVNAATNSTGKVYFSHPKYGLVNARIQSINVRHDDTQNYAEIEVQLIEDAIKTNSRVVTDQDIELVAQRLQADTINGEITKMNNNLESLGIGDQFKKLENVTGNITTYLKKASSAAYKWAKAAENAVAKCEAFAASIEQPVNVAISAMNFSSDVPARVLGSIQRVSDRIAALSTTMSSSPTTTTSAYVTYTNDLIDSITGDHADMFQQQIRVVASAALGVMLAKKFASDTRERKAQAKMAETPSFDMNGRRISKSTQPDILTITDIERSLYNTRAFIQVAIDTDRNNDTIKRLAMELVSHVDQLKLQSLDIKTITVSMIPLHLLCVQLGLPYNQASRILKINSDITNPSFVSGEIDAYIRP